MNSCGLDFTDITGNFTNEEPSELRKEYYFSEWYDIVKDLCKTPKSFIFAPENLHDGTIDKQISKLPNKECFARLDPLSSKPHYPFVNSKQIVESFSNSERCSGFLNTKVIIREFVHGLYDEFRCFVVRKRFRGISTPIPLSEEQVLQIGKLVNLITHYTDYNDYSVDFGWVNGELILIEINSPVWLYATSGEFDLNDIVDREVLLGKYIPDIVNYPVVKVSNPC